MDRNILNIVLRNKDSFVPLVFTEKQIDVLRKHYNGNKLSNAEKKALYTSVSRKIKALELLSREQKGIELFINGSNDIIPSRLAEAREIIESYSKKHVRVFVAGSFLFSREFNDIDVFVVRKKGYKEEWNGNKHIIFLPEKRLANHVLQSALLISVSNFILPNKIDKRKLALSELMGLYHEAVIECIRVEKKPESVRSLIFEHSIFCLNKLLNGKELKERAGRIKLDELDKMIKELCEKLFSETYLYVEVHDYIKTLKESIENIKPNEHLIRFKNTYEEMIYAKAKAA